MLSPEVPGRRLLSRWILAAVPVAAAILAYQSLFPGEFVQEDRQVVDRAEKISDPARGLFFDALSPDRIDRDYRPLQYLTYSLDLRAGGSAARFRAMNVAINAAAAVVAYFLLLLLLGDAVLAALGATLFAVLPVRSDAVASVLGRGELLGTLAVLASWLVALRRSGRHDSAAGSPGTGAAVGTLTFLGLLAGGYPVAVVPVLIAASALVLRRRLPSWALLGSTSAVAGYVALRLVILQGRTYPISVVENPLALADVLTRTLNGAQLLALYAWKTAAPLRLTSDYSYPEIAVRSTSDPLAWAIALGVSVIVVATVAASWRRLPLAGLAALLFVVALVPTANVFRPERAIFAERFASTASLALPLVLCAAIAGASRAIPGSVGSRGGERRRGGQVGMGSRGSHGNPGGGRVPEDAGGGVPGSTGRRRTLGLAFLVLLAVAFAGRTWVRCLDWADAETMESGLAAQPSRSFRLLLRDAEAALIGRRYEEGIDILDRMERLLREARSSDIEPSLHRLRADCRLGLGRDAEALADYDRYLDALRRLGRKPDARTLSQRGVVLGRMGRLHDALAAFDAALEIAESTPEAWNNRGYCKYQLKDYLGAVEDYWRGAEVCRAQGILHADDGDSTYSFLLRIADVYDRAEKAHTASGNEDGARMARAEATRCRAEAASLAPGR